MKEMNKLEKYIFGVILVLRLNPFFALAETWFEPDPYHLKVVRFCSSMIFVLCSVLWLVKSLNTQSSKRRVGFSFVWVLMELIYLTHAIIQLFSTDATGSYLVLVGVITIPILSYKFKFNVFRYSYK